MRLLVWLPVVIAINNTSSNYTPQDTSDPGLHDTSCNIRCNESLLRPASLPKADLIKGRWIVGIDPPEHNVANDTTLASLHGSGRSSSAIKNVMAATLSLVSELAKNDFFGRFKYINIESTSIYISGRDCALHSAPTANLESMANLASRWASEVTDATLSQELHSFAAAIGTRVHAIIKVSEALSPDAYALEEALVRIALEELRYDPLLTDATMADIA